MRWIFEVAMIGIASGWKWLLASVGVVGAVVGILFAVGVLGGGGDADLPPFKASPTPTPATASTIATAPPMTYLP